MNIAQIEENVQSLLKNYSEDTFIFNFLEVFGKPKSSIARLQNGNYNLLNKTDEILWKKVVYFKSTKSEKLHSQIDDARKNKAIIGHQPRFLIVTDFKTLLAVDTKTDDTLDTAFSELGKNFDFFLPWAGMEKAQDKNESLADVKAAEKMAKLYDEILKDNPVKSTEELHQLNVFLSRLLFCFFAEDTEIFPKASFTRSISSHTQLDGSDLNTYLHKLFEVLNTPDRTKYSEFLKVFPYVNGGLFTDSIFVPKFSVRSRAMLIEAGELDWSDINPDIFGSMFQAVVHVDQRAEMGMHYTSVPNIMKVIEPLFLNELYEEFNKANDSENKLEALLLRIEKIRIFDPACGSGNFLIIAYKEIRNLEMLILQRVNQLSRNKTLRFSNISLSKFYGIEIDDFAHEIAILSLWLAEHQMNVKFKEVFGNANPLLPLKSGGVIVANNSARLDWNDVCENDGNNEIYILGNPPYLGARQQDKEQKLDIQLNLGEIKGFSDLDYISIWFKKAAHYIKNTNSKYAFVSTNSISQGVQVSILWKYIFNLGIEIEFAHTTFKWANNAKNNAGVSCVIIGLRNVSNNPKTIYDNNLKINVANINGYLSNAKNLFIESRRVAISGLPPINYGSFALDDGNYTLSASEKDLLIEESDSAKKFIRPFIGAKELLHGAERYCLWMINQDVNKINHESIKSRIQSVKLWRTKSDREATRKLANQPHEFAEVRQPNRQYLALPTISSERREYLPIAFLMPEIIASNQIYIIPDAHAHHFGILASKMHILWVKAVCGQLETRVRYSAAIGYNNFPVPTLSKSQIDSISSLSFNVLKIRENHSEKTLAQLYDPDQMPKELLKAHKELDFAVEQSYRAKPFTSDEEKLEYLFKLYEQMINNEKSKVNA